MSATILCAEDDRNLLQIHRKALIAQGYQVLDAPDGAQALALLEESQPDLLLLDLQLSKHDGLEIVERMRRRESGASGAPVLLFSSGRISAGCQKRIDAAGATATLRKPIALEDLVSRVGTLVERATPVPAAKPRAATARKPKLPMKGTFEEVDFASLLHGLHVAKTSGTLLVSSGKKKKAIQLRDGYPVAVKSNLITECLGNMLVELGRVTSDELSESIERVKAGEGLQGEILVAMNVLDEESVGDALREQAERKLMEIFGWRSGAYEIHPGKSIQRANALSLDDNPADIVLKGVRTQVRKRSLQRFFAENAARYPKRSADPFLRDQSVTLESTERTLLDGIDGSRSLAEFSRGTDEVRRTVYGLISIGLLELHGGPEGAGPSARPQAPKASKAAEATLRSELTEIARRMRGQTCYEMLGLATTAGDEAVRTAYEERIARMHPDRHRHASEAVRQIADEIVRGLEGAYRSLKDVESRAAYAEALKAENLEARAKVRNRRVVLAESAFQEAERALRARDYEGALVLFGRAVEQFPEDGEYHAHYGWCLHLCHPDNEVIAQEAIEHVTRGIKLARDREKPYLFLGRLYKAVGKVGPAEKMFTRAVQIDSDCVEALRELRLMNLRREKGKGILTRLLRR